MGTGTDVAKDASSMVLADDNFATIISAVQQGRGIFANLRKVVHFLLSANASEVLLMFIGFLAFGFLGVPVLAVQLLWINLVTDGLPAIALGLDPPEPGLMAGAPLEDRSILSGPQQLSLLGKGSILAAASLAMLVVGHYLLDLPFPEVRTAVFTTLVLAQLLYVFVVRSERAPAWRRGSDRQSMAAVRRYRFAPPSTRRRLYERRAEVVRHRRPLCRDLALDHRPEPVGPRGNGAGLGGGHAPGGYSCGDTKPSSLTSANTASAPSPMNTTLPPPAVPTPPGITTLFTWSLSSS